MYQGTKRKAPEPDTDSEDKDYTPDPNEERTEDHEFSEDEISSSDAPVCSTDPNESDEDNIGFIYVY